MTIELKIGTVIEFGDVYFFPSEGMRARVVSEPVLVNIDEDAPVDLQDDEEMWIVKIDFSEFEAHNLEHNGIAGDLYLEVTESDAEVELYLPAKDVWCKSIRVVTETE